ncbi:hypothetical protein N656DRAFT_398383 [Canariomyces notabilis]|uniref:Uncharacterized protein n=1 Tax=Canariomyces notabilis TaxID=2074819 RepID=A0AAN6YVY6_9PEZI|nr:hypothetical protein N656DRAFT_398383 [Canariomyces arenarius]
MLSSGTTWRTTPHPICSAISDSLMSIIATFTYLVLLSPLSHNGEPRSRWLRYPLEQEVADHAFATLPGIQSERVKHG